MLSSFFFFLLGPGFLDCPVFRGFCPVPHLLPPPTPLQLCGKQLLELGYKLFPGRRGMGRVCLCSRSPRLRAFSILPSERVRARRQLLNPHCWQRAAAYVPWKSCTRCSFSGSHFPPGERWESVLQSTPLPSQAWGKSQSPEVFPSVSNLGCWWGIRLGVGMRALAWLALSGHRCAGVLAALPVSGAWCCCCLQAGVWGGSLCHGGQPHGGFTWVKPGLSVVLLTQSFLLFDKVLKPLIAASSACFACADLTGLCSLQDSAQLNPTSSP